MPSFAVEVHPLAADEAEAAERWYRERNETAATRFRRELDRAVGLIAERPEAAPLTSATPDAFCSVGSLSSSSIACSASASKWSPLHTPDGDRITGFNAEMTIGTRSTMGRRRAKRREPVTRGTENVFADLGFTDAAERQARLRLAYALNRVLEAREVSKADAAKMSGITQARVSALHHYKLAGFSVERLTNLLAALDQGITPEW